MKQARLASRQSVKLSQLYDSHWLGIRQPYQYLLFGRFFLIQQAVALPLLRWHLRPDLRAKSDREIL
jgi:hypothetical protein